jgi:peptidoglycan/LPS O-acetylase OafA/YrhL
VRPPVPPVATAQRSGALDGLRGFAALAVVFCHLSVSLGLLPYPSGGFVGVLVFFVLSGYLITAGCWRTAGPWSGYMRFLKRRVQRLAPAVLGLAVLGTPAMVLWGRQPLNEALSSAALAASQLTGLAIPLGYPWHPAWAPTWSLTVEWTFYLAFPLVLLTAKRSGRSSRSTRNAAVVLAGVLYGAGMALDPQSFYVLPVANLAVMLSGAALALTHHNRAQRIERLEGGRMGPGSPWPTFALVLVTLVVLLPGSSLGIGYKFVLVPLVTLAVLAIIEGSMSGGSTARVLGWRPLSFLGLRAYSLYLWHMLVFWLVWANLPRGMSKWLVTLICVACLVPVVALSYRHLERPWLKVHDALNGHEAPLDDHRTCEPDARSSRLQDPSPEPTSGR